MSFDRIENTIGVIRKFSFIMFIESFLKSRRIWVVYSLNHLLSVSLTLECVRILSWFISLFIFQLSPWRCFVQGNHVTNHLTCSNKLRFVLQFDLTNQNYWKIFLFFISYFLILKCQDLVIKVIYSSLKIKSCYPELV